MKNIILESKQDFLKKYLKFMKSNPGLRLDNPEDWFDAFQKCHQGIRKYLGGISKSIRVNVQGQIMPLSKDNWYLSQVLQKMPSYLSDAKLTIDDVLYSNLKKYKGISTAKHMKGYAIKHCYSNVIIYIDRLSNNYGDQKLTDGNYKLQISTDIMDFVKLGHFGIDSGVCFSNEGINASHKYYLGLKTDTFILKIFKDKNLIGRCWGKRFKNGPLVFSNFYTKYINNSTIQYLLKQIYKDKEKFYVDASDDVYISMHGYEVYRNEDAMVLTNKSESEWAEFEYSFEDCKGIPDVDFSVPVNSPNDYDIQ